MCPARAQVEILTDILAPMGADVIDAVFYGNAARLYRLTYLPARPLQG
ncbi:hypothetical protein OEG84_20850 [Hoeflea sp. G2-23]|uniref:Amidohydrolase-related domain-containing protein n=1 Tax=Hoeflea algicola TaxID=2983763 RepID=A0ABT3ZE59_9HYPH|nr:hypothetical protein [Hoeflea algicola]MCY0150084.1 hypothetical protein [Hoeflea algicola]